MPGNDKFSGARFHDRNSTIHDVRVENMDISIKNSIVSEVSVIATWSLPGLPILNIDLTVTTA